MRRYAPGVLLLDTSRSPEAFVPRLLASYLDELDEIDASRRIEAHAALVELAGVERSPEELLVELLEIAPDESIAWLQRTLDRCPPERRDALTRRLAFLAALVQRAEERFLDSELLAEVRERHGASLGDALAEVTPPFLHVPRD